MARAPEGQGGFGQSITFVVHLPLPGGKPETVMSQPEQYEAFVPGSGAGDRLRLSI
jgi:hypothetical protein